MLKTFVKLVAVLVITVSANAGTAGGDANGRLYNTAYFDVTLKNQNPMLDYIKYSKRGSFDLEQYLGTVNKIGERWFTVNIKGRIVVPEDITTQQVYVNIGNPKYVYDDSNGGRWLYYNGSKQHQTAEYFLVDTKKDKFGSRYIDFDIKSTHKYGDQVRADWIQTPAKIIFSVAPKTRGFKNKFEKADIYVLDE